MAVLIPRHRTIGVRLSEEEYEALEQFCAEGGARSISDLARSAIASFLNRSRQEKSLTSTVNRQAAQVKDLEQRIERLSAEIASLRTAGVLGQNQGENNA